VSILEKSVETIDPDQQHLNQYGVTGQQFGFSSALNM